MKPEEFTCFPRFHRDEVESGKKRAGRYQRKLIREFKAYILGLGGVTEIVLGSGPLRIIKWATVNQACRYGGIFVSHYTPIEGQPQYQFKAKIVVDDIVMFDRKEIAR